MDKAWGKNGQVQPRGRTQRSQHSYLHMNYRKEKDPLYSAIGEESITREKYIGM